MPQEPRASSVRLVDAEQVRPDELEQVNLLSVERIDTGALEPASNARAADAEHLGECSLRAKINTERFHLGRSSEGHRPSLAQQVSLR
jgi:hypothetical protein